MNDLKIAMVFLVYETGHKEGNVFGAKTIYTYGVVVPNKAIEESEPQDRKHGVKYWIYSVRINLKKRVDPKNGIPLDKMREIAGVTIIQRHGGLLKISKEQFDKLCSELEKRV